MKKEMSTLYYSPAPNTDIGWKNDAVPLGNGLIGAVVFGRCDREVIQLTDKTLCFHNATLNDARHNAGVENFGYLYIDFDHNQEEISNYQRKLNLNTAVCSVNYSCDGISFHREYFASYPERCIVVHMEGSVPESLNLSVSGEIAFLRKYCGEKDSNTGKTGTIRTENDTLIIEGNSEYYNVDFEGLFKVLSDGKITAKDTKVYVEEASYVTIIGTIGTNYQLDEKVTMEYDRLKKLEGNPHPDEQLRERIEQASKLSYHELKQRHISDFQEIFDRVIFDIGGVKDGRSTKELIQSAQNGHQEKYLEELYFQYGRYMSISTSRKGGLPSSLVAGWNNEYLASWKGGYWYNINQQINYWAVFSTNMHEMFEAYDDFNQARKKALQRVAANCVKMVFPDKHVDDEGGDGWYVPTANTPYDVGEFRPHSGPGTGGLTTAAYIDYYEFTQDEKILQDSVYPMLEGMAKFYSKFVEKVDGKYLAIQSASPEQIHNGVYYSTKGCAFDQQMIYNNNYYLLKLYEKYKEQLPKCDEELIEVIKEQIDKYEPVLVGKSGQIKEFREEEYYGDIGEKNHRHISNLMGLYPGTLINDTTPAWVDAAKVTLRFRGLDVGKGWSQAHLLNLCARTGDGESAYYHIQRMMKSYLFDNMWNKHDSCINLDCCVYQADGNFGVTAGISEMLCQSHNGYIEILPALPKGWEKGTFSGLVARGNFNISVKWKDMCAVHIQIISNAGKKARIRYCNISKAKVHSNGKEIPFAMVENGLIEFETTKGQVFDITGIPRHEISAMIEKLDYVRNGNDITLKWRKVPNAVYTVLRAIENSPVYEFLATDLVQNEFETEFAFRQCTYKVVAKEEHKEFGAGATVTVCDTERDECIVPESEVVKVLKYAFDNPKSNIENLFDNREDTEWISNVIKFNRGNPFFILDIGKRKRISGVILHTSNKIDQPTFIRVYISDIADMFENVPVYEGSVLYAEDELTTLPLKLKDAVGRYLRIEILGIRGKRNSGYYLAIKELEIHSCLL